MNLSEKYIERMQPGKYGYLRYVKLNEINCKINKHFVPGSVYEIDKIIPCRKLFSCKENCPTQCQAFYLKTENGSICACGLQLENTMGESIIVTN